MKEFKYCIKCDSKLWNQINHYLINWKYKTELVSFTDWNSYPLLVIGNSGFCDNWEISALNGYDIWLITDIEEFLEKAASLMGFNYKEEKWKNYKLNGVMIESGMIIEVINHFYFVVFPTVFSYGVVSISNGNWYTFEYFLKNYKKDICKIYSKPINEDTIISGNILWEMKKL